jgi:hypothetical protein
MDLLASEERAGLSDTALELAVWRGILKRLLGVRAFEAVERIVSDELRTQQ